MTKPEALTAMKAIADENGIYLTVTERGNGECVVISWQDGEHRILQILWEKK